MPLASLPCGKLAWQPRGMYQPASCGAWPSPQPSPCKLALASLQPRGPESASGFGPGEEAFAIGALNRFRQNRLAPAPCAAGVHGGHIIEVEARTIPPAVRVIPPAVAVHGLAFGGAVHGAAGRLLAIMAVMILGAGLCCRVSQRRGNERQTCRKSSELITKTHGRPLR